MTQLFEELDKLEDQDVQKNQEAEEEESSNNNNESDEKKNM